MLFTRLIRKLLDRFYPQKLGSTVVRDRLQFVLIHDRAQVEPATLEALKLDLITVFTKYFEVNKEAMEINVRRHRSISTLVVNIPFKRSKSIPERGQKKSFPSAQREVLTSNDIRTSRYFCPNKECPNYGKQGPDNQIIRSGYYLRGDERMQRLKCLVCGKRFSVSRHPQHSELTKG